jgi:hypothetical protein
MRTKLVIALISILSVSTSVLAQTAGTLTFSFNQPQPTSPAPNSGIKSVLAVWIENNAGTFIKTKMRYVGASTDDHLPTWGSKSGCANATITTGTACNTTDASTGATRTTSTTPPAFGARSITWDGKNVVGTTNGTTVADGIYKIWIESSWVDSGSNNHNELISFPFTKGASAVHLTPTGDTYINNVVLDWIPAAMATSSFDAAPNAVIYPIPSNGTLNISIKNQVKKLNLLNLLGQIVYTKEYHGDNSNSTLQVNLENVSDGNYIVNLSNENGVSNYEIILKK